MKILYLITKGDRGGAQSHLWTLMRLQSFGEPLLALGEEGFLADEARSAGIPVHVIPHLVHPVHPLRDLRALGELIHLIRSEKPAIIHAHTAKAGMLARMAGCLTRTPTIYTVHGWSFEAMSTPLWKSMSLWIERVLSLTNQTVIDVSRSNFQMAEQKAVARPGHHLVIWNGIPDNPHRASLEREEDPVRIIMVARLAPQKDHILFLEALAPLPRNWECSFVGDGPDRAKVEAKAEELGLHGRVCFLGDRNDVPELLAQSDLFVLSTHYEGLPISILEAMRAGLPVIASSVGGCPELVTDEVTGFLVKPGDVGQLRDRLQKLLGSQTLRRSFGREGRRRFEADFGVEGMIRQTVAAYSQMRPQVFTEVAVRS